jgi:hypothetical protein
MVTTSQGATTPGGAHTATTIRAWEDDPATTAGAMPIDRPVPQLSKTPLAINIVAVAPPATPHDPGTKEFRYWAAADALRRGADYWGTLIPAGTTWEPGAQLDVHLDEGVDLNAFYNREGLSFFHDTVAGHTVFSGESPDVVCHELGHAVLDAIRPQLWDAASDEVAAFHESFGDMSAILSALQLPSIRTAVLTATGGKLNSTSRLSRLAEQLGAAIRHSRPDLVDPDCLRNAVNAFFYRDPTTLPPSGPATMLTSEAHSFSRVFTGAFFEALAGMMSLPGVPGQSDEDKLAAISVDIGHLLIDAVSTAPVVPDYYSQVAAHMIEADANRFTRRYRDILKSAFVRRGILSLEAAAAITEPLSTPAVRMSMVAANGNGAIPGAPSTGSDKLPQMALSVANFGLGAQSIFVHVPAEPKRFSVTSAALNLTALTPPAHDEVARNFLANLLSRGHVDIDDLGDENARVAHPYTQTKTHKITKDSVTGNLVLVRQQIDCGFDG